MAEKIREKVGGEGEHRGGRGGGASDTDDHDSEDINKLTSVVPLPWAQYCLISESVSCSLSLPLSLRAN